MAELESNPSPPAHESRNHANLSCLRQAYSFIFPSRVSKAKTKSSSRINRISEQALKTKERLMAAKTSSKVDRVSEPDLKMLPTAKAKAKSGSKVNRISKPALKTRQRKVTEMNADQFQEKLHTRKAIESKLLKIPEAKLRKPETRTVGAEDVRKVPLKVADSHPNDVKHYFDC